MQRVKRTHNHGKRLCWWCLANTMAFPVEHFVWEKLPGFSLITHILGL